MVASLDSDRATLQRNDPDSAVESVALRSRGPSERLPYLRGEHRQRGDGHWSAPRTMSCMRLIARPSPVPLGLRIALDRRFVFALGTLASAVSILVPASTTDAAGVRQLLSEANWAIVGLAVGSLAMSMVVRAARWQVILPVKESGKPPIRRVLPIVLVGYAINALVPMRLGDLFRGLAASRRFHIGRPEALGSIGLGRVADAGALAAVAAVASVGSVAPAWLTSGGLIVGIAAGFVIAAVYLADVARRPGSAPTERWKSIILRAWVDFRAHPRALAIAWSLSAIARPSEAPLRELQS